MTNEIFEVQLKPSNKNVLKINSEGFPRLSRSDRRAPG